MAAMTPYFTEKFGNAGSIGHTFGDEAREAVELARASLGEHLHVAANEIVFTSGATESNNLAIRGVADRLRAQPGHVISVNTEHKAVLDPLARLEKQGWSVTLLSPAPWDAPCPGRIDPEAIEAALTPETRLVSVMLVNNEIGVVQPVRDIADRCRDHGVLMHCDATQAVGRMPVDVDALGVDLLSFSGHKIYGPRGMGALIVRRRRPRIKLAPLFEGGGQEEGRRSGTLNVPGIVGLAAALQLCVDELPGERQRITDLRNKLFRRINDELPDVCLNGPPLEERIAGNLNLRFSGVDGEALMMNMRDVAVSSGSACTSANPEPSHVLRGIGLSEDLTRSSLRFGLGRFNSEDDIDIAASTLIRVVPRLRGLTT